MLFSFLSSLLLAVSVVHAAPTANGDSTLSERATLAQVYTKCTVPNTVALTFDDGPYIFLYDISKALVAAGAKGTFFFNGNNWGCIYDPDEAKRVAYAYDKGHQVASHTWSHKNLSTLSYDNNHNEFWLVEEALMKITGAYPAWVRPPYGAYNDVVRNVAAVRGMNLVNWDFDSGDTWGITTQQVEQRYNDIIAAHPSTILTLNHEVHQQTAQVVVPYVIKALQKAGYRLVTLAECLGKPAYKTVGTRQARDASWTCAGKPTPVAAVVADTSSTATSSSATSSSATTTSTTTTSTTTTATSTTTTAVATTTVF